MKRFIAAIIVCFGLIIATPSSGWIPGYEEMPIKPMTGVVDGDQFACFADDLNAESKATLNRWIELNRKKTAGTITEEELAEGGRLAIHQDYDVETMQPVLHGLCGMLPGGTPLTVKLLDGLDYFVVAPDGQTFIFKGDGFKRDAE